MMNDADLKVVIKGLGDTLALASDASKGFSFKEIGEIIQVGQDIQSMMAAAGAIPTEWLALDDMGRADLVGFVSANVKFPASVPVEVWTQKILDLAVSLSAVFQAVVPKV